MKDLSDMSKMPLTHYINSHLSVLYTTVIPIFLSVSSLRTALEHILDLFMSCDFSVLSWLVSIWNRWRAYPATIEELLHDLAKRVGHAARLVLDLHPDPDHSRWPPVPPDLEESRDPLQNGKQTRCA